MRFYEPDLAVNFGYLIWVTSEMLKETYKTKQKGDYKKATVIAYACRIVCVCVSLHMHTFVYVCMYMYIHIRMYGFLCFSVLRSEQISQNFLPLP